MIFFVSVKWFGQVYLLLHSDFIRPIRKQHLIKFYSDRLDWTPAVLDNFVTFIYTWRSVPERIHVNSCLHWQDHSFYTEGARRQEMFVRDKRRQGPDVRRTAHCQHASQHVRKLCHHSFVTWTGDGLFDDNWRIRYSSIKLLGELR